MTHLKLEESERLAALLTAKEMPVYAQSRYNSLKEYYGKWRRRYRHHLRQFIELEKAKMAESRMRDE